MAGRHQNRLKSIWPQDMRDELDEDNPHSWRDVAKTWEQNLEHRMGDHPTATLVVAATLGFVLGWLVKRK